MVAGIGDDVVDGIDGVRARDDAHSIRNLTRKKRSDRYVFLVQMTFAHAVGTDPVRTEIRQDLLHAVQAQTLRQADRQDEVHAVVGLGVVVEIRQSPAQVHRTAAAHRRGMDGSVPSPAVLHRFSHTSGTHRDSVAYPHDALAVRSRRMAEHRVGSEGRSHRLLVHRMAVLL